MKLAKPLLILLLMASVGWVAGCGNDTSSAAGQGEVPPVPVSVVTLATTSATLSTELPARAQAFRKAEVRPQVSGIIQQRLFTEGERVEAGQPLYQIDPARFEAALQTAEAQLARGQANLVAAQAREHRYSDLVAQKAVSQQDYDDAQAAFAQAKAEVAVAEAALLTARIDLEYSQVTAPISGYIGKSSVTEGALVSGQQAQILATIHQLDPLYVDMTQSSRHMLELRQQVLSGTLAREDAPKVTVILEDGSEYEHAGELQFSDMHINASTGSIMLRALVPNPKGLLLPGAFVRVILNEGVRDQALLVPQRAVSRNREGAAVAWVVEDGLAVLRPLVLGRSIGGQWLVESGLQAGDQVIVEGLQRVTPDARVNVTDVIQAED